MKSSSEDHTNEATGSTGQRKHPRQQKQGENAGDGDQDKVHPTPHPSCGHALDKCLNIP